MKGYELYLDSIGGDDYDLSTLIQFFLELCNHSSVYCTEDSPPSGIRKESYKKLSIPGVNRES